MYNLDLLIYVYAYIYIYIYIYMYFCMCGRLRARSGNLAGPPRMHTQRCCVTVFQLDAIYLSIYSMLCDSILYVYIYNMF